jgi:hypothetical protein
MTVYERVSSGIVLIMPAIVIIYDVFVFEAFGRDATITAAVQKMARNWGELPWVVAGLFVWLWLHLFGTQILGDLVSHAGPQH